MLCSGCNKYNKCQELCKKAEEYVNQDHVPQMQRVVQYKDSSGYDLVEIAEINELNTTDMEEIIVYEIFLRGGKYRKTQSQLADILSVTQQCVSKVVNKYREILYRNLKK